MLLSSEVMETDFAEDESSMHSDWQFDFAGDSLVAEVPVDKELGVYIVPCLFLPSVESCFLGFSADRISSAETFLKNIPLLMSFDLMY